MIKILTKINRHSYLNFFLMERNQSKLQIYCKLIQIKYNIVESNQKVSMSNFLKVLVSKLKEYTKTQLEINDI
ncbi:unnamed protein product [Paramecium sonneborni]|uniref:Uncharacterized protein n=1 Tax=Paramecium sonneborni TaxID=65129 RepID=A0A8S1RHZ9_9CILI|nr:unnamed protein product [Paramecium sonneborni]